MDKIIVLVIYFVISILTFSISLPVLAELKSSEEENSLSEIPYKKQSDVSVDTTVNVFVFIVSVLFLCAIGIYFLKKNGFTFPYNIVQSDDLTVLSINKISRKTTLYKIKLDGQEIRILESSENIMILNKSEA